MTTCEVLEPPQNPPKVATDTQDDDDREAIGRVVAQFLNPAIRVANSLRCWW